MEFGQDQELVKDQYSDSREEEQEQEDNDAHVDQNPVVIRNTSMMRSSLPFSLYAPSSSSSSSPHQQSWPQLKDYLSPKPGCNPGAVEPSVADSGAAAREHMFDKVVTPSDVGKLNRLVIPKQHAERFFPLDSAANEKGLLLSFEDRTGKSWRFRYSYWNSSQSYVMTKGWSRFVKEKSLDAGDIVSFERNAAGDRLFIDWRRRNHHQHQHHHHFHPYHQILHSLPVPISVPIAPPRNYENLLYNYHGSGIPYHQHQQQQQHQHRHHYQHHHNLHQDFMNYHQFSAVQLPPAAATPRRLRLFGVNMECRPADDQVETRVSSSSVQYPLQVRIPTHSPSILPLPRPSSFQTEFSQFMGTSSSNTLSFDLDP